MKIQEISRLLSGTLVTGEANSDLAVEYAFASDLMSDVLTVKNDRLLLITGLVNVQTIRTAEMSDIACIVLVRNKKVTEEMISVADESRVAIIQSPYSMFRASGLLYDAGIKPVF